MNGRMCDCFLIVKNYLDLCFSLAGLHRERIVNFFCECPEVLMGNMQGDIDTLYIHMNIHAVVCRAK